jgi:hypothetical protein
VSVSAVEQLLGEIGVTVGLESSVDASQAGPLELTWTGYIWVPAGQ